VAFGWQTRQMTTTSPDGSTRLYEEPVRRQQIHKGRLISYFDDEVKLTDGTVAHREVVEHPGAVAIVACDDQGRVVLVRQWRHPVGRALWELPAGTRDRSDEAPESTAERELEEETGLRARAWRKLGFWPLVPGYSTEVMHFYAASGLEPCDAHSDADERLEPGYFTNSEVMELVRAGEVDVKTIAGLALAGWQLALADG
jgi:8-oxo-dGTP pyrophosphatase MutT (NUDIX family)